MICNYAIIENVNHTVCLEIRFSDSPTCQPQNPVGVPLNIPQLPGCKKKNKQNKQTRTLWGGYKLNISRLQNLSNLWNQRNLRNRYDEEKNNNKN